ncbi:unnamed protein product [Hyaloperonospora brassicae]|uniref:RRM domain-containing protein n=1 Tax=Hyaloperonospora brassicae TaxID=162125 RepID=A0AAV0TE45_HYABA|nr:unnamed protein product [Hyaloperonospora brassicae]
MGRPTDGTASGRGFAYVTLEGADAAAQSAALQQTFHRTKWRGATLQVQAARLDFRERLEREWAAQTRASAQQRERLQQWKCHRDAADVRPLKVAVAFQGRRTTEFADVDGGVELQDVGTSGEETAAVETDSETVVEEKDEAADEDSDDGSSDEGSSGEGGSGDVGLREDDVEAFMQQYLAAEAAAGVEMATKQPQKELSREAMNARRLAALDAKQKRKKESMAMPAIGAALGNKKITFDDSGSEQALKADEAEDGAGVTLNWMDSSDDEAGGDESEWKTLDFVDGRDSGGATAGGDAEAQASFALRPEFVGETGRKLFEMQKRFGGDARFRLDARFLEEEVNEYGGNDVEGDEDDEGLEEQAVAELQRFREDDDSEVAARHAREMREEQEAALRVVAKLYPDVDVTRLQRRMQERRVPKDRLKEAAWMGELKRYDPRDVHACREFEIPMAVAASGPHEATAAPQRSKELPKGGDRFFSTAGDLSNIFSRVRKNSEDGEEGEAALDGVLGLGQTAASGSDAPFKLSSLFSFPAGTDKPLAAMGEQLLEDEQEEEAATSTGTHDSAFLQGFHPTDTVYHEDDVMATDSEAGDDADDVEQPQTALSKTTRATKSLDDFLAFGRTFVGGGDIGDWPERRKKLTLDYRRKRRDAVKMKKRQVKAQGKATKTKSEAKLTETATASKWKKARV